MRVTRLRKAVALFMIDVGARNQGFWETPVNRSERICNVYIPQSKTSLSNKRGLS